MMILAIFSLSGQIGFLVFLIIVCHQYTHDVYRQYKAYNSFCSAHFNREMID